MYYVKPVHLIYISTVYGWVMVPVTAVAMAIAFGNETWQ